MNIKSKSLVGFNIFSWLAELSEPRPRFWFSFLRRSNPKTTLMIFFSCLDQLSSMTLANFSKYLFLAFLRYLPNNIKQQTPNNQLLKYKTHLDFNQNLPKFKNCRSKKVALPLHQLNTLLALRVNIARSLSIDSRLKHL